MGAATVAVTDSTFDKEVRQSTVPVGGGYTAEVLMADADTAVAHLGPSTIVGRGLGGYIAVLLAGATAGAER